MSVCMCVFCMSMDEDKQNSGTFFIASFIAVKFKNDQLSFTE